LCFNGFVHHKVIFEMKKLITFFLLLTYFASQSQDRNTLFTQAIKKLESSDYEAAILLLNKVIQVNPADYPALYNRAVAKSILKQYQPALLDINQAINVKKDAKKAYLQRAIIRKKLTDFEGAFADFDQALKLDPKYADAIYNKAVLYEFLGKIDEACEEFRKAKEAGSPAAYPKVDFCETPIEERVKTISVTKLETISSDKTYGFSNKNPVKVGAGSNGGLENEQTYLDLLRDETGQPISYVFKGKCCDYFSKKAQGGRGFLSQYEINYKLKNGSAKSVTVFLNQFEFEQPKVLLGFDTIKAIK
jgi:tetratricopeptide (TPR) repeat protein